MTELFDRMHRLVIELVERMSRRFTVDTPRRVDEHGWGSADDSDLDAATEDSTFSVFGLRDAKTPDRERKSDAQPSCLKRALCPAVSLGGLTVTNVMAAKLGLASLEPYIPWTIMLGAAVCFGRGLVHISQGKLNRYDPVMRWLTVANFLPVGAIWAIASAVSFQHPDSPGPLLLLLGLGCAALWLLAALQGTVVNRLHASSMRGESRYPDIESGTARVAAVDVFKTGVTIGHLARIARLALIRPGETISKLVAATLLVGAYLAGYNLFHNMQSSVKPAATTVSSTPHQPPPQSSPPAPSPTPPATSDTPPPPTPSPSDPTTEIPYAPLCAGRGLDPGAGGPSWSVDKINAAWFGPGGNVAGCAQGVHVIPDKNCPIAWEVGVDRDGDMASVVVASKCLPDAAIYLDNSAAIVQPMLAAGIPLTGSCRRSSGAGDVQLVYSSFGTIALVRTNISDDTHTQTLPPAVTAGWGQSMASRGMMMWPRQLSSTTWSFVDASGSDLDASVHVTYTGADPKFAIAGTLTDRGKQTPVHSGTQSLASLTPGAAETCH